MLDQLSQKEGEKRGQSTYKQHAYNRFTEESPPRVEDVYLLNANNGQSRNEIHQRRLVTEASPPRASIQLVKQATFVDKLDGLIGQKKGQATMVASPSGKAKFVKKQTRRDTIQDTIRLVDQIKDRKRRNSRAAF